MCVHRCSTVHSYWMTIYYTCVHGTYYPIFSYGNEESQKQTLTLWTDASSTEIQLVCPRKPTGVMLSASSREPDCRGS